MENKKDYIFIGKTVFFTKNGILAVGDLHLGYEHMLKAAGIGIPEMQIKGIIEDLKKIFEDIKNRGYKLKKIVFLGDIKHYFGFEFSEKRSFEDVLEFLRNYFDEKDIILIKGNHDAVEYHGSRMKNYYVNKGIAFLHGHRDFPAIYDKEVKTIVLGHLHPSVVISDKLKVKREKFKCFLVGRSKGKELIVLPSFFEIVEGMSVNDYGEVYHDFISIVPKKVLLDSEIFVIGENETYDFGKVKDLK
ncbi:MAG TPA: metallophosphoesterase [Candidatus Omnitrophota bacterium]|nr:metallophosphoesterase [Candidatus Omnitrophota bacterium]